MNHREFIAAGIEQEERKTAKAGRARGAGSDLSRLGTRGVDHPSFIAVLRERGYDVWISLDFNAADMLPGVTIEHDMTAHRRYVVETLHATMKR